MRQTRHDIELAKKFMHELKGAHPNLEHIANLITIARSTLPSEGRDTGPWHFGKSEDGRFYLESDDFTHDVRFYLDGDFTGDGQRMLYLQYVLGVLNAATSPKEGEITNIRETIPPPITGAMVQKRRDEAGIGGYTAKQQLMDERVAIMIARYKEEPDHLLLAEILVNLQPNRLNG